MKVFVFLHYFSGKNHFLVILEDTCFSYSAEFKYRVYLFTCLLCPLTQFMSQGR